MMKLSFLVVLALFVASVESYHCKIAISNVTVLNLDGGTSERQDVLFFASDLGDGQIFNNSRSDSFPSNYTKIGFQDIDGTGKFLIPSLIDSNIHLYQLLRSDSNKPTSGRMQEVMTGLGAAVSLGFSANSLTIKDEVINPFKVLRSGPLFVSAAFFANSDGDVERFVEVTTENAIESVIRHLNLRNYDFVQVFIDPLHPFDDETLATIRGATTKKIIAKVFDVASAERAITILHADVLSQAPLGTLDGTTVDAWKAANDGKLPAVISALVASSGLGANNLKLLHEKGALILYGTNSGEDLHVGDGINIAELNALAQALGGRTAALRAASSTPASFWISNEGSVSDAWKPSGGVIGVIQPNATASFLLLDSNPLLGFDVLKPASSSIFISGVEMSCVFPECLTYCSPEPSSSDESVDRAWEYAIGVIVPIVFFGFILLMILIGVVYHIFVRRPRNKKRVRSSLDDWENED